MFLLAIIKICFKIADIVELSEKTLVKKISKDN